MTLRRRRLTDRLMHALAAGAAGLTIAPLVLIFGFLLYRGGTAVNLAFFTELPKPVGEPAEKPKRKRAPAKKKEEKSE